VRLLLQRILLRRERLALLVERRRPLRVDQRHAGAAERLGLEHDALDLDRPEVERHVAGRGRLAITAGVAAGRRGGRRLGATTRHEGRRQATEEEPRADHVAVLTPDPRPVAARRA